MPASTAPPPLLRTALRAVAVVVTLTLVGWVALLLVGQLFRSDDRLAATFTDVSRLRIATEFEAVEIIGSDSATSVSVQRSWNWSLREPQTAMTQTGDTLSITSACPFTPGPECRGIVKVVAPAGLAVDITTGDGALHLENLAGPITLDTGDGAVAASHLRAADVSAVTGDGNVHLVFSKPPTTVTVTSNDGDIHVELPGTGDAYRVEAKTGDGTQSVEVPTDPAANRRVDVSTQDGTARVTTR